MHPHGVGGGAGSQPVLCAPWQARIILEKATKVSFKQVDDLASVWCECGELELRHENYDQALRLLRVNTGPGLGWGRGVLCCVARSGTSLSPPSAAGPRRRPPRCPPAGPSTSTARSLCRTVYTSR